MSASPHAASEKPFIGLRPFGRKDASWFFGREEQVQALLERLEEHRFLAVIGASGSGKSSLVSAGLLPALDRGFLTGADQPWDRIEMRPGEDPLGALAEALHAASPRPEETRPLVPHVLASLRTGPLGGLEALRQLGLGADGRPVLILVDQFEEIFRYATALAEPTTEPVRGDSSTRMGFAPAIAAVLRTTWRWFGFEDVFRDLSAVQEESKAAEGTGNDPAPPSEASGVRREDAARLVGILLASASADPAGDAPKVYVVLTMRSDFVGHCDRFAGLSEAVSENQYLVPRLTRRQMEQAVRGPLMRVGVEVEDRLVAESINAAGTDPDALPLLQHALLRTWDQACRRGSKEGRERPTRLLWDDYWRAGQFADALSRDAEAVFAKLDAEERRIAEAMFRSLCRQDPEGPLVRRVATVGEVASRARCRPDAVIRVIRAFREEDRNFLLLKPSSLLDEPAESADSDPRHGLIDISHEALLRRWGRLREWVREESRTIDFYRYLSDKAEQWSRSPKYTTLLRPPDLQRAVAWLKEYGDVPEWAERLRPRTFRRASFYIRFSAFWHGAFWLSVWTAAVVAIAFVGWLGWRVFEERSEKAVLYEAEKKQRLEKEGALRTAESRREENQRLLARNWAGVIGLGQGLPKVEANVLWEIAGLQPENEALRTNLWSVIGDDDDARRRLVDRFPLVFRAAVGLEASRAEAVAPGIGVRGFDPGSGMGMLVLRGAIATPEAVRERWSVALGSVIRSGSSGWPGEWHEVIAASPSASRRRLVEQWVGVLEDGSPGGWLVLLNHTLARWDDRDRFLRVLPLDALIRRTREAFELIFDERRSDLFSGLLETVDRLEPKESWDPVRREALSLFRGSLSRVSLPNVEILVNLDTSHSEELARTKSQLIEAAMAVMSESDRRSLVSRLLDRLYSPYGLPSDRAALRDSELRGLCARATLPLLREEGASASLTFMEQAAHQAIQVGGPVADEIAKGIARWLGSSVGQQTLSRETFRPTIFLELAVRTSPSVAVTMTKAIDGLLSSTESPTGLKVRFERPVYDLDRTLSDSITAVVESLFRCPEAGALGDARFATMLRFSEGARADFQRRVMDCVTGRFESERSDDETSYSEASFFWRVDPLVFASRFSALLARNPDRWIGMLSASLGRTRGSRGQVKVEPSEANASIAVAALLKSLDRIPEEVRDDASDCVARLGARSSVSVASSIAERLLHPPVGSWITSHPRRSELLVALWPRMDPRLMAEAVNLLSASETTEAITTQIEEIVGGSLAKNDPRIGAIVDGILDHVPEEGLRPLLRDRGASRWLDLGVAAGGARVGRMARIVANHWAGLPLSSTGGLDDIRRLKAQPAPITESLARAAELDPIAASTLAHGMVLRLRADIHPSREVEVDMHLRTLLAAAGSVQSPAVGFRLVALVAGGLATPGGVAADVTPEPETLQAAARAVERLSPVEILEMLKYPTAIGWIEEVLVNGLQRHAGGAVFEGDIWKAAAWAKTQPGLDTRRPPRRPTLPTIGADGVWNWDPEPAAKR